MYIYICYLAARSVADLGRMSKGDLAARGPEMTKLRRFVRASALQHHLMALPPETDRANVTNDCVQPFKIG